mmetsp:Transcript_16229/g.26586  ORF Transcript_16229/g.26586 Transcript_16229/m.26586 type:complete len:312 (-) Transcript_16229:162-1097(-)|eukprot:CAMPEP_0184349126 /NCGR_PEP_ID=MMETSP1089-20130417/32185_1 /TAXON_ID=38269 ORGANISM="Gloeochaete wittrockiana, Strain SAG46.84" /NCGR_SAMPLE_ID=MMETSP1089 /ASSEMBLY_ACC=CAM_ASM_000445 /LENGTH=311 /DNA_ID=CAMNT_0026681197 /DNA_START=39 /DNA_END=974 /DNA_ORIENTATION=+
MPRHTFLGLLILLLSEVSAHPGVCSESDRLGVDIGDKLPVGFEPSDLVVKNSSVYIVSDEGTVAEMTFIGDVRNVWHVEKGKDMEGIAVLPSRPDFVYVAIEFPPAIEEYDLLNKKITRHWDVAQYSPNGEDGIEALAYVYRDEPDSTKKKDEFFYVGYQRSAVIHVFEVPPMIEDSTSQLTYRGFIKPPGPGSDLAALYTWQNNLYANFDKPRTMVSMSLWDTKFFPPPGEDLKTDARRDTAVMWEFDRRGQEGVAFGKCADGHIYFFVAEDPPKDKGRKTVRRYDADKLDACFKTWDGSSVVIQSDAFP